MGQACARAANRDGLAIGTDTDITRADKAKDAARAVKGGNARTGCADELEQGCAGLVEIARKVGVTADHKIV